MKEWYSISDLLALGHPLLPTTQQGMFDRAEGYGWHGDGAAAFVKTEIVRGGETRFYHFKLLPEVVKRFIALDAQVDPEAERLRAQGAAYEMRRETLWDAYQRAPEVSRKAAEFRLECMNAVRDLMPPHRLRGAVFLVSKEKDVPESTLMSWHKMLKGIDRVDRLAALLPGSSNGRPTKDIDPRVFSLFKTFWLRPEKPSMAHAHSDTVEAAEAEGFGAVPAAKTLRAHIIAEIGHAAVIAAREGKKSLEDLYPHMTRDISGLHAMHTVNADGHVVDTFVEWEDGTIGRPTLLGFQDIYSRMLLSCRIGRSETRELIRLAIGDMIRGYGVPELCYFDNGRAFASKHITGDAAGRRFRGKIKEEDPVGVFSNLDVRVKFVRPYHGQSKPVERAWGDLAERVAKNIKFAGAYVGKNPMAKPENYGSKAIPIAEFRMVVADEIIKHNQRMGRDVQAGKGLSFFEIFKRSISDPSVVIRRPTEAQLSFCLLACEMKTVQKRRGEIGFMDHRYWTEELIAHRGKQVMIRFDPDNLSAGLHVYSIKGVFICFAECLEAGEFNSLEAAQDHARKRGAFRRKTLEKLSKAIDLSPEQAAEMLPQIVAEEMPLQNVVGMSFAPTMQSAPTNTAAADAFSRGLTASLGISSIFDHPSKKNVGG